MYVLAAEQIIIGFGIILIAGVGYIAYNIFKPFCAVTEIARNVKITGDWNEIIPRPSMKIKRGFQFIDLKIEGARLQLDRSKIQLPDGRAIALEIQIQGSDENWHDLKSGRYGLSNIDIDNDTAEIGSVSFSVRGDQKEYLQVRIRSNEPFTCSKIIWRNHNLK